MTEKIKIKNKNVKSKYMGGRHKHIAKRARTERKEKR